MSNFALPVRHLPWPLPAMLGWALAWAGHGLLVAAGAGLPVAALAASLVGVGCAWRVDRPLRRALVALGYPVSAMLLLGGGPGAAALPAWAWLLPLALAWVAYPLRAWRDAPFFPTARGALDPLAEVVHLAPGARVLDAGCGLGDGLIALRRAWPRARFSGIEWSLPLRWLCALRCRWAQVRRGDMWSLSWQGYQAVYLFQRPESMARAVAKARREMAPGSWLVSLEFEAPGLAPHARLQQPGQRLVWVYRVHPLPALRPAGAAQLKRRSADNSEALPGR